MEEHPNLRTAIAALKDANPALTARQVHETLVASAECWKELPLASVKKMCSKMTKAAMAANAVAAAAPAEAADTVGIDPTALPAWAGLESVPPRRADGSECRPLEWCFQAAMPQAAKIALSLGGDEGTMDAYAQMVYSLFHIVHAYESTPSMYRAALETRDGAALLIDVLQPACACPSAVEACRVGSGDTAAAPLLAVRYLHLPGAAELRALPPDEAAAAAEARVQAARQTMAPGCPYATAALLAKGAQPPGLVTTIEAESADEIEEALRHLRANEAALAPAYVARFFEGSRWHDADGGGGGSGFRPSFLVPPVAPPDDAVCSVCGASAQGHFHGRWATGGKLGRLAFCSRECQQKQKDEPRDVERAHERGGDAVPRRKYKAAVLL